MKGSILCAWLGASVAFAQATNPFAGDAKAAEAGRATFSKHCSSCHGQSGDGGRAPDLTRTSLDDAGLFRTISNGVPGTEMSAYARRVDEPGIWGIVTFLRTSRAGGAVSGDARRGETLFWGKGGCGNCHAAGNRGNKIGPDLSRVGRQRSVAYLRESLTAPSADIAGGYRSITVTTNDGKSLRGVQRALDDFSVVFQDFSGKVYSFHRGDARSVVRDTQSMMPDYKSLPTSELDDLVAYLFSLREAPKP